MGLSPSGVRPRTRIPLQPSADTQAFYCDLRWDGYDAKATVVYCALRLMPLVFVRPGELRSFGYTAKNSNQRRERAMDLQTHPPATNRSPDIC